MTFWDSQSGMFGGSLRAVDVRKFLGILRLVKEMCHFGIPKKQCLGLVGSRMKKLFYRRSHMFFHNVILNWNRRGSQQIESHSQRLKIHFWSVVFPMPQKILSTSFLFSTNARPPPDTPCCPFSSVISPCQKEYFHWVYCFQQYQWPSVAYREWWELRANRKQNPSANELPHHRNNSCVLQSGNRLSAPS